MLDCEKVPLFPLQAVLFPGMSIPLHIFEPRYRQMIEECVKSNGPFGVVLIRKGSEIDDGSAPPEISRIGCLARIDRTEQLKDGRYFVEATGSIRFALKRTSYTRPYLTASVTPLGEQSSDPARLDLLSECVRDQFRSYITQLLERMNRTVSTIRLPEDATALSYAVAGAMDIPLLEKQRLLEAPSADARLELETQLLKSHSDAPRKSPGAGNDEMAGKTAKGDAATIKRITASAARSQLSKN